MIYPSVDLQIVSASVPSVPCWFGEVATVARLLTTSEVLQAIEQRVRFARPRFGTYEVIDFFAVLIGYAVSGESTLQAFYERLTPFATTFIPHDAQRERRKRTRKKGKRLLEVGRTLGPHDQRRREDDTSLEESLSFARSSSVPIPKRRRRGKRHFIILLPYSSTFLYITQNNRSM